MKKRKLLAYIAMSLDGKIATADGGVDWLPHEEGEDFGYADFIKRIDTNLMGYKTFEICLSFGEWYYAEQKNYVFSRQNRSTDLAGVEFVNSNPVDFTRSLLEQEGKDIWVIGGGDILSQLQSAGLIDEYHIAVIPVILGNKSIPLFTDDCRREALKLEACKHYKNGLVMLSYYR